ncbi:HET-domain-containing protein [Hypoxylon rubiginosum]|uniref:HET-domain-containing protein n=1 Tax=Hypoxylon rubiginosum TaxID=110542 RepID=A0ACC0CJM9_9PEZI|nr:HET-domain-containing protein [Hypoxylon rubiginosum]
MRFLKAIVAKETGILEVIEKNANQIPQYAILSHTWEKDEVKFEDIESGRAKDVTQNALEAKIETSPFEARSLSKLKYACIQAAKDGYEYIWIDSCCIDKRNSAELTEAINSMFAWYRDAAVCYAFLLNAPDDLSTTEAESEFAGNRWFQRGFTLQELLAPTHVTFFSGNWVPIGQKKSLCTLLARITGIDADILRGDRPIGSTSLARRMSWAAKRVTTRPEDSAYCLMGIFSVNMPMLYGEGAERAFIRLQEEIMKQSDDHSLFAWVNPSSHPDAMAGLLAPSPSCFLLSTSIFPYEDWEPSDPYTVTNRGLRIDLHLTPCDDGTFVAALDCPVPPDYEDSNFLALYLAKLSDSDDQYARVKTGEFASVSRRGPLQTIYVRQQPHAPSPEGVYPHHLIQLRSGPLPTVYKLIRILHPARMKTDSTARPTRYSARYWVPENLRTVFVMRRKPRQLSAALIFQRGDGELLAVMIGTLGGFDIAFDVHAELDGDGLTFERMETEFNASADIRFQREYHSVAVAATPVIHSSSKYYMIDIDIMAIGSSLRDAVGGIVEQAYNTVTGSGHGETGALMSSALPAPPAPSKEQVGKADDNDRKPTLWKKLVNGIR